MCAYIHNFTHTHTQCTCWVAKWVTHYYMYWNMFCKIIRVLFKPVELFFLSIKKEVILCHPLYMHACVHVYTHFSRFPGYRRCKMYEWLQRTNNQRYIVFCSYLLVMDQVNVISLNWFAWNLMRILCLKSSLQNHFL
jgi:hypothetical protein